MSEIDYPEEFTPIAAGLQRLPYLSPSAKFADRVMSRVRIQSAKAPELSVVQGGATGHVPDSALVRSRRRKLITVAVGVPAGVGILIAVSVIFAQLDVLTVLLSAGAAGVSPVIGVIGATAGNLFLGSDVMMTLEAGTAQTVLIYIVMVLGLVGGYSGIKLAGEIAKRKAA